MESDMKIGIDMDDVVTNALIAVQKVEPRWDVTDWNGGMEPAECAEVWKKVAEQPNFWALLDPLPSFDAETRGLLLDTHYAHDVWFITDRFQTPGLSSPLKQTKYWFGKHTLLHMPNILIAKGKGPAASVLQLDAFIDDRPKNCIDVKTAMPYCRVYLADSSHNKPFSDPCIPRVKDLKEFLKLIMEAN
jgi:hypothetical protein